MYAEDRWAGLLRHDEIHENDTHEHAAADGLFDRLCMAFFPLEDQLEVPEFFIRAPTLAQIKCLISDDHRSCRLKSASILIFKEAGR